ncbi:MAG: SH3 domain-containing protein [Clostridia bacterium]|nr:SH3 domain-containing protein [Clostridia bacterium]
MKRLVSLLLVICMMVPCLAFAEDEIVILEDVEDVFGEVPEEIVEIPAEDDLVVLPESDDLLMLPTEEVDGPDPYRELVLLQPTDLLGTAVDVNTVRLSWGPVAFATQYDVYRKLGGEAEYTRIASTPSTQLYFEDTDVTPGQVMYYRVQAVNVSYDGESSVLTYSPQSNTLPFITLAAPEMKDPRGMGEDTIRLEWTKVDGKTTYEVQYATNPAGPFTDMKVDLTNNLCNAEGLTSGQGYYFRARAVRTFSSGEVFCSDYSNVACGTPMVKPELTVTADGNNAVLSWTGSAGATGYVIYRKIQGGDYQKLTITGAVTSYVDADRTPGEVCYYFVYAMRPVGTYNCFSLSSETKYFTIVDPVTICAVQNTGDQEQTIDWAAHAAGANKYYVYASTTMDGIYSQIGETAETTFVATGLEAGSTYYYKVRPVRIFSNGDMSYGPWSNVMSMPEAGALQLGGFSATNLTYASENGGKDIAGGYVGDVFNWNTTVSGGSGAYTFKYSLVSIKTGSALLLKDFDDAYKTLEEGAITYTDSFSMTLTEQHIDLINNQGYAMQIEVMDSLGAVATQIACGDTQVEMSFVAAKPVTKMVNVTLRAGETLELDHGIYAEAGDTVIMDVADPSSAVSISGSTLTAKSNGYVTILITPSRFTNDVLVAYNITVGYAALKVTGVTPSATTINTGDTLAWDISFTGGRPNYTVNFKVYRDAILVADNTSTKTTTGVMSVNYQPNAAGTYYLEVNITAADGQTVTQRSAATTVKSYTPVTVAPTTTSTTTGNNIAWVTTYNGTNTVVRRDYTLFRDGMVVSSSVGTNDFSFSYVPTVAGSYVLKVVVYEANGNTYTATSATVTVVTGNTTGGTTSGTGNGIVTGTNVALRKGPGTNYGKITRLPTGTELIILKQEGKWYYVNYNGTLGFMHSGYVKYK